MSIFKATIPAIHPLTQEQTEDALAHLLMAIRANPLRFVKEVEPNMNERGRALLQLAIDLGFVEPDYALAAAADVFAVQRRFH